HAVLLPARQIDAGAPLDGSRLVARPHTAAAYEDAEDLLVLVVVVGCAAERDDADELWELDAPDVVVEQHPVPAVADRLGTAIVQAHHGKLRIAGGRLRALARIWSPRADERQRLRVLDLEGRPGRHVDDHVGSDPALDALE